jgi:hypothetical protein
MSFLDHLIDAPLANILILAGLLFVGIAALGKITGKIEPDKTGRILSGLLGVILLVIGTFVHVKNDSSSKSTSKQEQPATAQPNIQMFSITPSNVTKGGEVTIRWEVSNADEVELEPLGQVVAMGSRTDFPQQTTIYRLSAANKNGGRAEEARRVVVSEATQTVDQGPHRPVPNFAGTWLETTPPASGQKPMQLRIVQHGAQLDLLFVLTRYAKTVTITDGKATWEYAQGCGQQFRHSGYDYNGPGLAGTATHTLSLTGSTLVYEWEIHYTLPCGAGGNPPPDVRELRRIAE